MDILKFSLKGKTAFFKKPEVNTYISFTYGMIHKVALLGMLGAVRGYGGYAAYKKEEEEYPEFYKRLSDIRCAIIPQYESDVSEKKIKQFYSPNKKIQQFNNSVGYASKEQGGNLIVKEQWLENPAWDIFIALDCEEAIKLSEDLLAKRCIYIPYLGKNDHLADIEGVEILKNCEVQSAYEKIDSLYEKEKVVYKKIDEFEEEDMEIRKYEETLPYALNKDTHMYESKKFICSNLPIERYQGDVYQAGDNMIVFF